MTRIAELLYFLECHPSSGLMQMFGKTSILRGQYEETLRRWIAAGRPDPEELLEDVGRVETDSWCSWRDCMLMIELHEWLTANNPSESSSSSSVPHVVPKETV